MSGTSIVQATINVALLLILGYIAVMAVQSALWRLSLSPIMHKDRTWSVVNTYSNSNDAAKLLSDSHWSMIRFMDILRKKYHIDETNEIISAEGSAHIATEGSTYVNAMIDNYNPDTIYENDPARSSDTSYTVGKGAHTYFCLRNRQDPTRLVDSNTFMFVMLHECSHIANYKSMNHDKQFWTVFKFILAEAVNAGIYNAVDYARYPVDYCGLTINYQPLNDRNLRAIK